MPKYQLLYFDGIGKAELARWLFVAAGQEYEDIRMKKAEWPKIKPTTPFGQVPVVTVDGEFKLAQSLTIGRFLAKRFGFMGKDEFEEARCNMFMDCTQDMRQAYRNTVVGEETVKAAAKEKWNTGQRDQYLDNFEKLLTSNKNGTGFFVGDGLTVADMCFCIVAEVLDGDASLDWSKYPKLAALRKRVVKDNRKIAEWIAKRPVTEF